MKSSNNFSQEKGHGYFRKRNKVLVSMITVFGSLMLSSVAMADEVASTTTSSTNVTTSSQPATSNETTSEHLLQQLVRRPLVSNLLQQLVRKPQRLLQVKRHHLCLKLQVQLNQQLVVLQWQQALITHQKSKTM